jgi:hypothetical protein
MEAIFKHISSTSSTRAIPLLLDSSLSFDEIQTTINHRIIRRLRERCVSTEASLRVTTNDLKQALDSPTTDSLTPADFRGLKM